jgi:cell division protein ZapA (FtsZ GTPase activity inhibitor)
MQEAIAMKSNQQHQVTTVNIFKRQYTIKSPVEEVTTLHSAARYLDKKMSAFAATNQLASTDEIGVITALNIIQEIMRQNSQLEETIHNLNKRVTALQNKLENTVTQQTEIAL